MSKTRYEKSNLAQVLGKRGAQEVDTCALHKTRRICDENAAAPLRGPLLNIGVFGRAVQIAR